VRSFSPHIYRNECGQLRSNAAECIRLAEAARTSQQGSNGPPVPPGPSVERSMPAQVEAAKLLTSDEHGG
jgi:hypothetical protein